MNVGDEVVVNGQCTDCCASGCWNRRGTIKDYMNPPEGHKVSVVWSDKGVGGWCTPDIRIVSLYPPSI